MDMSPFTRAGLTQKEISELVNVSRVSVWHWMKGRRTPHHLLAPRVRTILDKVDSAVSEGALPLSATVPRAKRMGKIRNILRKQKQNAA